MVELGKCMLYVVLHRDVCITLLIILIQVQSAVWFTLPIDGYLVMVFDCIDYMEGVVFEKNLTPSFSTQSTKVVLQEVWRQRLVVYFMGS